MFKAIRRPVLGFARGETKTGASRSMEWIEEFSRGVSKRGSSQGRGAAPAATLS